MTRLSILLFAAALGFAQAPDPGLLQQTLTRHVTADGKVRYAALKADPAPLDGFVGRMETVSPETHPALFPSREARLAYWINAYNALVLHAMSSGYPTEKRRLESTVTRTYFFYRRKFRVGNRDRTLSQIEDTDLREGFRDPRIHFAIVCASKGCPWLSRTAYTAANVNGQLEQAAAQFFSQLRNCTIDTAARRIRVSSIFKWFARDFGADDAARLAFIAKYRPAEAAALRSGAWKFEYVEWDWSLNDAP